MKSRLPLAAGVCAAFVASAQAEVKINENVSIDGYVIGSGVMTEGSAGTNDPVFGESGVPYDSAYLAINGTYKGFSGKLAVYTFNPFDGAQSSPGVDGVLGTADDVAVDNVGILDAYVTYKIGDLSITGGKYLGWLGFESFHSPNNAFISFSKATYASPWATGAKVDYAGKGFSTGVSVRDSQIAGGDGFFEGDGEFGDDIGYEVYFMLTSLENLTLFAGAGYEDVDGGDQVLTTDIWASYAITDKFSLAAEVATLQDATDFSWLVQATYALTEKLSLAGRLTAADGLNGTGDSTGYGVASTYTIAENFSVKGEVSASDGSAGDPDTVSYALQALFRF